MGGDSVEVRNRKKLKEAKIKESNKSLTVNDKEIDWVELNNCIIHGDILLRNCKIEGDILILSSIIDGELKAGFTILNASKKPKHVLKTQTMKINCEGKKMSKALRKLYKLYREVILGGKR